MKTNQQNYNELAFYTLSLQDKSFIHQHIVDAQSAQTADENTKTITIIFALVGLYLWLEENFTGREVQLFHIKMSNSKIQWPKIILPEFRGNIVVSDVLDAAPGTDRAEMIRKWCESVWNAFKDNRETIIHLVWQYGINK